MFNWFENKMRDVKKSCDKLTDTAEGDESEGNTDNHLLENWAMRCFHDSHIPRTTISHVFCPLSSLAMFVFVFLTLSKDEQKRTKHAILFSDKSLILLSEVLDKVPKREQKMFVEYNAYIHPDSRLLKQFVQTTRSLLGEVLVARPFDAAARDLRSRTMGLLSFEGREKATVGIAASGVRARWKGKALPFEAGAFATSFGGRQMQQYIHLHTRAKTIRNENFEAWQIPLMCSSTSSSEERLILVLIRPFIMGEFESMVDHLTGPAVYSTLVDLSYEKSIEVDILLPRMQLHNECDLLEHWRSRGMLPSESRSDKSKKEKRKLPPLHSIRHWAHIAFTERGVACKPFDKREPNEVLHMSITHPRSTQYTPESRLHPNRPFNVRFDAPFLFMVALAQSAIPLVMGCYAGDPAEPVRGKRDRLSREKASREKLSKETGSAEKTSKESAKSAKTIKKVHSKESSSRESVKSTSVRTARRISRKKKKEDSKRERTKTTVIKGKETRSMKIIKKKLNKYQEGRKKAQEKHRAEKDERSAKASHVEGKSKKIRGVKGWIKTSLDKSRRKMKEKLGKKKKHENENHSDSAASCTRSKE